MKLGIDFGTTRIVVAYADRGNYPVVVFDTPDGSSQEWLPPLVAVRGEERVYGWEAWAAQEHPGWTIVRSLKRALESAGPETRVQVGEQVVPMRQLLIEMVSSLRANLLEHSSLPAPRVGEESLEVMLGVPANANTNQRFLTTEAFREAGFEVLGLLNEPSAASIEFGHRNRERAGRQSKEKLNILVYDLGGGTFDASLVELEGLEHRVIASEGITTLGGDDFDDILAELALGSSPAIARERDSLSQSELFRLHEECRNKKEAIQPNTRQVPIDLGLVRSEWGQVSLPVQEYYDRCRTLVEETLHATEDLLTQQGYAEGTAALAESNPESGQRLDALYVTGGASELPIVARMLREVFGRRVKRSAYTRSATAIGLAIQADAQAGYTLREKFMRYFGVWREADGGRQVVFDPLFPRGEILPTRGDPSLERARRYSPIHNIGHFRYLECSHLTPDGRPTGDITFWDDIRFAFDSHLRALGDLKAVPVEHLSNGQHPRIEETYSCDSSGAVAVTITDLDAGFSSRYRLGRWATKDEAPIVPGRKKRGTGKGSKQPGHSG